MIDGSLGRLHVLGGPGLHLDEGENLAVPANQIELAAPAGRTVVARDHYVALLAEVEIRILFALTAYLLVRRQVPPGATLRAETIENTKSRLREWGQEVQNAT
jgi:hypothetical protein